MTRGQKVNKSQAIRDELEALGLDASPKEVVSRLAKKGIRVTSQNVSTIKHRLGKGQRGHGHKGTAPNEPGLKEDAIRTAQSSGRAHGQIGLVASGSVTTWLTAVKTAKQDLGEHVAKELFDLA
jgi:hypothetical protein